MKRGMAGWDGRLPCKNKGFPFDLDQGWPIEVCYQTATQHGGIQQRQEAIRAPRNGLLQFPEIFKIWCPIQELSNFNNKIEDPVHRAHPPVYLSLELCGGLAIPGIFGPVTGRRQVP
jgi:hypothetical protein